MVQAGMGGLDTPRTNVGDGTYLANPQFDFDMSQEQSFQSPSKDKNNLVHHMQNGRRGLNLNTPRSRAVLGDRRNLPAQLGGGEFTPLLKSATRNSALQNGKENVPQTPAFLKPGGLDNIAEDLSALPIDSSAYGPSRNGSYMAGTPFQQMDSSSAASTPMAMLPRRNEGPGVLQEGNQLSLREQENVIDKIEKENFGLKLKIHFLEEALRKAGPGFNETTVKENTDLKIDRVTMQKELIRYKKTMSSAERDLELYRQQLIEMQEKMKRKHSDEGAREEVERLRRALEEKEDELDQLRSRQGQFAEFEDKIQDLQDDLRQKDRELDDRDDEVENLKDELKKQAEQISDMEDAAKKAQRRAVELEEQAQASEELEDAKETISELEQQMKRIQAEADDAKEDCQEAIREKERAEADLEELQEEISNKSMTSKGLNRQIEEKANRLQDSLEDLQDKHTTLEKQHSDKISAVNKLQNQIEQLIEGSQAREQGFQDKLEVVQNERDALSRERQLLTQRLNSAEKEIQQKSDEKNLLQHRHDSLTSESAGLQRDLAKSRTEIEDLTDKLDQEKTLALSNERDVRDQYKVEIDRLNDEIEDLRADLRRKEQEYDNDNDKWDRERRSLISQKEAAEQRAVGLQQTIDRLQVLEGNLSGKESKLQEAISSEQSRRVSQEAAFKRQIEELNEDIEARRTACDQARSELVAVREELRLSQREQKSLAEKVEGLEDEVEILQTSLDDESDQANTDIAAAKQESESLRKYILTLKQDLARAESAAAEAQAEIEHFQGNLEAGQSSKEQLSSRLRDVESQLTKVRQEKQALHDQLATLNIELHSLRASKSDVEVQLDEFKSQIRALRQQEEGTYNLEQDRVELRTAKSRLDGEVRRLRDENKSVVAQQQILEKELQQEIDRAAAEESRLNVEITDLQRILRGSTEKRELASAKKVIQQLEQRIQDLESQIESGDDQVDPHELSLVRRDLSTARQKESEFAQREAAQKEQIRSLKRQITELERKAHDAEISRFVTSSPPSSVGGSARKSELVEVRTQLATAHQSLKTVRAQLKEAEKEMIRKVSALTLELETQTTEWETEKDQLEHTLDEALFKYKELQAKNITSEATITRLRGKVDRLEKALQSERLKPNNDRNMVQERRDLHEMLRETQLQVETLELVIQERDKTISSLSTMESDLRTQMKRIREERAQHKNKSLTAQHELQSLNQKFKKSREAWEVEKRGLCKGVRFPNQSLSVNEDGESQVIAKLKQEWDEKAHYHVKEMRGMTMQVEWLRARCKREERFRIEAAYAKKYMALQIACFEAWFVFPCPLSKYFR